MYSSQISSHYRQIFYCYPCATATSTSTCSTLHSQVHLENGNNLAASDFLGEMEQAGIQPNRVTFQHLVGSTNITN